MPSSSASVIRLRPSRILVCVFFIFVAMSCGASWESQLPSFWHLVVSVSACGYGIYLMLRYALLRHSMSITAISFQQSTQSWMVCINRAHWLSATLLPQTWVTRFFIVLQVQCGGKRHVALLVPDNVTQGLFTALQRQLLFR